jgi:hypothetical protein
MRNEFVAKGARSADRRETLLEARQSRYGVSHHFWLVRANGSISSATMVNVSRDGFCLKTSESPTIGESVVLRGGAGDVPAKIRWATADRAGGTFLIPEDD